MNPLEREFTSYSNEKLTQCFDSIRICIGLLTPEQVWMRHAEHQNAAGNLLLHLNGNLQQWILAGVAGETLSRDRAAEFSARQGASPEELIAQLAATLEKAKNIIASLPEGRLMDRVQIQGHHVTVLEAIYHVVEHFSGHTGQIIFLTKLLTSEDLGFYSYLAVPGAAAARKP